MRIPLIIVGVSLLESFHWMIYVFGGLLVLTAARMIVQKKEKKIDVEKNIAVRLLRKVVPVSTELHGSKFLARVNGLVYATPLLVALLAGAMEKFHYLKPALIALLLFIGAKMIAADVYHIPVVMSLVIIGVILGSAVVMSVVRAAKKHETPASAHD
jgi:tellurite resistance protein TerC